MSISTRQNGSGMTVSTRKGRGSDSSMSISQMSSLGSYCNGGGDDDLEGGYNQIRIDFS